MSVVDLSMNETSFPPLPAVRRLVEEGAGRLNRYPDHGARPLVGALAARLDVPGTDIVAGSGSAGLLQHLLQALETGGGSRHEVVVAEPAFEAYPLIIMNAGARPVAVPLTGHRHDLAATAAAVTAGTRCVLLCNPHNPTGTALRHAEIEDFLGRIPPDVVVVLDEAYREFATDPETADGVELYRARDNVCVLRTFSKAYGLAGLRVGYVIAPTAIAAAVRTVGLTFFPGGLAQEAAVASLEPSARTELDRRLAEFAQERRRLADALTSAGLPVVPSEANFLWLPLGDDAERFAEECRRQDVLVRAYAGHGVRVTVGDGQANARMRDVALRIRGTGVTA